MHRPQFPYRAIGECLSSALEWNYERATRIVRSDHLVPFTADDFLRMMELGAFVDMRAELVRGRLQKMMPAPWTHGELNLAVGALLLAHLKPVGARVGSDVVLRIDDNTVRAADTFVVRPGIAPNPVLQGDDILLAVEIADNTLDRDMGDKRTDYACAGIPHYWVVD